MKSITLNELNDLIKKEAKELCASGYDAKYIGYENATLTENDFKSDIENMLIAKAIVNEDAEYHVNIDKMYLSFNYKENTISIQTDYHVWGHPEADPSDTAKDLTKTIKYLYKNN